MIESLVVDIPGVRPFINDIIIAGKDWKSHAESLNLMLQRLKNWGFHQKIQKCKFFLTEVNRPGESEDHFENST